MASGPVKQDVQKDPSSPVPRLLERKTEAALTGGADREVREHGQWARTPPADPSARPRACFSTPRWLKRIFLCDRVLRLHFVGDDIAGAAFDLSVHIHGPMSVPVHIMPVE